MDGPWKLQVWAATEENLIITRLVLRVGDE